MSVFGDSIRYKLGYRPKLVLKLGDRPQGTLDNDTNNPQAPPSEWTRYYHLRLTNEKERYPATNVRVVILRVMKPTTSGQLVDVHLHGPLQLNWQLAQVHPLYETVGPEIICDLGYVRRGKYFTLSPIVAVSPFQGTLDSGGGQMVVIVQAIADNAKSNLLKIKITWNGQWSEVDQVMRENLRVEPVD